MGEVCSIVLFILLFNLVGEVLTFGYSWVYGVGTDDEEGSIEEPTHLPDQW